MKSSYEKKIEDEKSLLKMTDDKYRKKMMVAEAKMRKKIEKATAGRDQLQQQVVDLKNKLATETSSFERKYENEKKMAKLANKENQEKIITAEIKCEKLEEDIAELKKKAVTETREKLAAIEEKNRDMIKEAN